MNTYQYDPSLARALVLDELFDLSLYRALHRIAADKDSRATLEELVKVETQHLAFWQKFFGQQLDRLDGGRRLKLHAMLLACRLLGTTGIHLVLEAIEVHGVRKYLALWQQYEHQPLGEALRGILMDEFKHEDVLVTALTHARSTQKTSAMCSSVLTMVSSRFWKLSADSLVRSGARQWC